MWRLSGLAVVALLVVSFIVWWSSASGSAPPPTPAAAATPAVAYPTGLTPESAEPGITVPLPAGPTYPLHDPVLITGCGLAAGWEQEVSSQVDGVLSEMLVDLGTPVARGQVLGRLDDRQLRPQVELLEIKAESESAELIAKAQHDDANRRVEYALKANQSGLRSVSDLEYQTYRAQRERFAQEMNKAREEREMAAKELERARRLLELHEIRSGLAGEVVRVYKRNGEAVKQGEPLFRIADSRRLRIEGLCRFQQANLIRAGTRVLVEPELPSEPLLELAGHTGAVHALAVAPDGRWVASVGEDRTAVLWSWPTGTRRAVLPHPAEVFALAVSGAGSAGGFQLLTGCGEGRVRLWRVTSRGEVRGPTVWEERHVGAICAVAASPDGRWFASAGEDRRVGLWDATTGQRLAWLQSETDGSDAHQGAVTSVQFTPDGHLVTAGRDNTIRVWQLGDGEPRVVATHAGRSGEVARLGVSSDGQRVLSEHGEELRILRRDDGTLLGSVRARRHGRFQGLALFSPTDRLILSAASNGRLQLLKAPAPTEVVRFLRGAYVEGFRPHSLGVLGALNFPPTPAASATWAALAAPPRGAPLPELWGLHGYEVRHLVLPSTAAVTCAAFMPDESVVFTAGTDRVIRAWPVPSASEWLRPREATITFVGSQVERGTDQVRIRAEMDNPPGNPVRLRPGAYTDLRLYPETAPAETHE